jgi:hypothetical protein
MSDNDVLDELEQERKRQAEDDPVSNIIRISDYVKREVAIEENSKKLSIPKSAIRAEIKRREKSRAEPAHAHAPTISDLATLAAAIIANKDVLGLFAQDWVKVMAGELNNAKLLYLMATTRLFDKCCSGAIKGPSGSGKSEVRLRVLDFFPPEDVISFTTLSEKSLLYFESDFSHKILSMGEAAGAEEQTLQDYLIRELISSGHLRYPVPQKIGGDIVTVIIEKNGPVCFFVTTTKAALHPENETRLVSLEVDDSADQTAAVLAKIAAIVGLNSASAAVLLEPWQNYQRWLGAGNRKVVVPFADKLAQLIPPKAVRLRRDFPQVLLAIKAHALLHRSHRGVDDRGQIVADLELDYVPVAELMGGIVAEGAGTSISKEVQATIDAVAKATAGKSTEDGASADKIGKLLKLDTSAAWRRLKVATNKGYIVNLEMRRGQRGRYRVSDQEVEAEPLLPSPKNVRAYPSEIHANAQTASQGTEKISEIDCKALRKRDANGTQTDLAFASPVQTPCKRQVLDEQKESASVCTFASDSEGSARAIAVCAHCAGEAEIGNDVEEWPNQPPLHAYCRGDWLMDQDHELDIPAFLDRRNHKEE